MATASQGPASTGPAGQFPRWHPPGKPEVGRRKGGGPAGDWAVRFAGYAPQPVTFAHYVVLEGKEGVQVAEQPRPRDHVTHCH